MSLVRRREPYAAENGRLFARPGATTPAPLGVAEASGPGMHPLRLSARRDALLYVPAGYRVGRPTALAVLLHGAGGDARGGLAPLLPLADAANLLLLAPASRHSTWDVLVGGFGPDVAMLDRALAWVFVRYAVDQQHLALGGFSDGASYALSLGLTNGDLFTHILAFTPGFLQLARERGKPAIYVSHGTDDRVLPIDACSRRLVPRLQRAGYNVRYHEFAGPHTVPADIASEAVDWFIAG
jgi:phospholipase/carboxylesterase